MPSERKIRLECHEGTSNKFYVVCINQEVNGTWTVGTGYGAIGNRARLDFDDNDGTGYTYNEAWRKYEKIVYSKKRKGYEEVAWEKIPRFANSDKVKSGPAVTPTLKETIMDDTPKDDVFKFGGKQGKRRLRL